LVVARQRATPPGLRGEPTASRMAAGLRCDVTSMGGHWAPAVEGNVTSTTPPCSAPDLFAAGLRFPQICGPRCHWQPPSQCGFIRIERDTVPACLRGRWIVVVGDSQVRNLCRFIARWLGISRRLPESMRPERSMNETSPAAPSSYYDDWDMHSTDDESGFELSFRFSGSDWSKYERVWRAPHQLETFDMKQLKHKGNLDSEARQPFVPLSRRRRPDLIVFSSSYWYPTCDRLERLADEFVSATHAGAAGAVEWALLGSYTGPLDKYEWPETKWACERAAAARAATRLLQTSPSNKGSRGGGKEGGGTGSWSHILDLKPLVGLEVAPAAVFERCPMIRREMTGLASGGGIHWGPALLDTWTQIILHALCAQDSQGEG